MVLVHKPYRGLMARTTDVFYLARAHHAGAARLQSSDLQVGRCRHGDLRREPYEVNMLGDNHSAIYSRARCDRRRASPARTRGSTRPEKSEPLEQLRIHASVIEVREQLVLFFPP